MKWFGHFAIFFGAPVFAQTTEPSDVISRDWMNSAIRVEKPGESSIVSLGDHVIELTTTTTPPSPWMAQIAIPTSADVLAGDVLLIEGDVRAAEADPDTKESALRIVAQLAEPPYTVHDEAVILATGSWQPQRLPLRVKADQPAGKMQIAINFGVCRQRVQLRNLSVRNLGQRASIAGLRSPPLSYFGREPDAPWRKAAAERIEKHRKADLTICVVDALGNPVPGAKVQITQQRHAFAFGTAVTKGRILGTGSDDEQYRKVLAAYFNTVVFENDLKWPAWEPGTAAQQREHRQQMHSAMDWLKSEKLQMSVRGHCLVWPEAQRLPADVQAMIKTKDRDGLQRRVDDHISRLTKEFAGTIDEWDVVNEATFHQAIQDVLGDSAMARWFHLAHQADPKAKLYLNDFAMLSYGALNEQKIARMYDLARQLREQGAPIHGIGEQAHFGDALVGPERVLSLFDRFAKLGLPIRITEFDVTTHDDQLQADYLRDFFTAAFSHPSVNGIVLWGFYQKNHWMPEAALWKNDWTRRPLGDAYVDLVTKLWHTAAAGETGADGRFATRGFLGDYRIVVSRDGREKVASPRLPAGGVEIKVQIP